MTDLPHFFPFRIAYEVNINFPLTHILLSRPTTRNYLLRFEVHDNHPIYKPIGTTMRIDMTHFEQPYASSEDSEECVHELLHGLINIMKTRIRPGTSMIMLKRYAPWANSSDYPSNTP